MGVPLVAVHVEHSANAEAVWPLLPESFDAVPGDRNIGAVLALGVSIPQYPSLLGSAAGTEGSRPFVVDAGELAGIPFGEALSHCAAAVPLGLLREGACAYVPAPDTLIAAGDGVILLAADRASAGLRRSPVRVGAPAELAVGSLTAEPGHVLVLGWSAAGSDLVRALPDSAGLTILARMDAPPPGVGESQLRAGDPGDGDAVAAAITATEPAIVVLLAGANGGGDAAGAYARAALSALKVSQLMPRPDLTIVVEQYASDHARRLRAADPRIRVVSRAELVAHGLLLSSVDRRGLLAHQGFVLDEHLSLEPVHATGDEPVSLADAYGSLLAHRAVPLVLSRDGAEIDLLEPAAEFVQPGDGLLLLRRAAHHT